MTENLPEPHERGRRSLAVSDEARAVFLEALGAGYSITHAAAAAGVHRRRFYELRDRDQGFVDDWRDAHEAGTDVLRDELRRRGVEGWDEPLVSAGKLVGVKRVYSDRLLELELKRRDPLYRDRPDVAVAISSPGADVKVQLGPAGFTLAEMLDQALASAVGNMLDATVAALARNGSLAFVLEWAAAKDADVQERVHGLLAASGRAELSPPAGEIVGFEDAPIDDASAYEAST